MSSLNTLARTFRSLHKPGEPILLANVYDAITARAIASLSSSHVIGTASWSVAAAAGLQDDDLDQETNLRAIKAIAPVAKEFNLPLTVDLQDGYGKKLEETVSEVIKMGAVGINLEDANKETGTMYSVEEAAVRIKRVMQEASANGVPDFVVNARTDTLLHDGSIDDAITRGKTYLAAGAANIFVWGGGKRGGVSRTEVVQLVKAFDGKLNVSVRLGGNENLSVRELAEIGVARCSVGPALQFPAIEVFSKVADSYLSAK